MHTHICVYVYNLGKKEFPRNDRDLVSLVTLITTKQQVNIQKIGNIEQDLDSPAIANLGKGKF